MRHEPIFNAGPAIVFAAMLAFGFGLNWLLDVLATGMDAFAFLALCIVGIGTVIALVSFFERRIHSRQSPQEAPSDLLPPSQ